MQSPNENIFDVLEKMRKRNFQPPYYQACINDYADRIEKCVCDLVKEVKDAVNQAWQTSLNSITEEFDRRIRYNLREKALRMFGKDACLTEIDRIGKGAVLASERQEDKEKETTMDNETEGKTAGNNAAMREALVLARERIVETKGYYDADADKEDYETLLAAIDAVLAAPARNCDKHANVKDAKTAWFNYKMSCPTPPGGWGDVDLLDWFLAPAEEDFDAG